MGLRFGLRCTIGIAVPLVLAYALHAPLLGVGAAFGAMAAGLASRQGRYRLRAASMLVTAAAMAGSAYVGGALGAFPVASFAGTAVWALGCGFVAVRGRTATTVGINAMLGFLIFGHPPYDSGGAWNALAILGGGALQTLLFVAVWPLQQFSLERLALARAYRELGSYAGTLADHGLGAPDARWLAAVGDALADPQPFGDRAELVQFAALLDEAERLRASLTALTTDRYFFAELGLWRTVSALEALAASVQPALGAIADALGPGSAASAPPPPWSEIAARMRELEACATHGGGSQCSADAQALLGQVRSAWRIATDPEGARPSAAVVPAETAAGEAVRDALETLRANASPRSVYAQHALRLALVLAVATLLERVIPLQRSYWIGLTALIVLRPEFTATVTRGAARVAGTVAGAVVASGLAALEPPGEAYLVLAILFAGAGFTLFSVNYGIFSAAITAYIVFLLALSGTPERAAALDRVAATLIGGALVFVVYLLRPTWSREHVAADLAEILEARRRYAVLVLRTHAGAGAGEAELRAAQAAARLARSNAEASVDQLAGEPVRPGAITVRSAVGILAASERLSIAALALHARLGRVPVVALPAFADLIDRLDGALDALVDALRAAAAPPALPPLRELQVQVQHELERAGAEGDAIVSATDLMVDGVNTIADILRRLPRKEPDVRT